MNKHLKKHAGIGTGFATIALGILGLTLLCVTTARAEESTTAVTGNSSTKKNSVLADGAAFVKFGGVGVSGKDYGGGGPMVDIGGQWGNHRLFLDVAFYSGNISAGSYLGTNALLATTLNYGYQFSLGKHARLIPAVGVGYPYVTLRLDAEFGNEQSSGGLFIGTYLDSSIQVRAMVGGLASYRF
ncbi:MAG: hypothetical protein QM529_07275 [Hydrotalea sp.]|nr:hypothetical protein [Hydrotalea sp.]